MSKRKLIILVGLPRSGKSTWAQQQGFPIVCPDAIRLALHGERFLGKAEPMVWVIVFMMVEALFIAGNDTIIIDATNVSKKRRDEWAFKFPGAEIELKVFTTSPAVCKERAILTKQEDLLPVIDRMVAQWDLLIPKQWTSCNEGCKGAEIAPGQFSGCSCPEGLLANGSVAPPDFECDCPNHPQAA